MDSLSLSGKVKSNKITSKFLDFNLFRLSERREWDSKLNLKSEEDFNNSSIRRTSALLSSISNISRFLFSMIIHLFFFIKVT